MKKSRVIQIFTEIEQIHFDTGLAIENVIEIHRVECKLDTDHGIELVYNIVKEQYYKMMKYKSVMKNN